MQVKTTSVNAPALSIRKRTIVARQPVQGSKFFEEETKSTSTTDLTIVTTPTQAV